MTTPNRFAFDIVGNDKASDKVDKVLSSIQRLIPALQQANVQFTTIQQTIQSIGTVNFGGLARAQVQAADNQQKTSERLRREDDRRAAASERRSQRELSLLRSEEAAYQRKIDTQHRVAAADARNAAMAEGSAQRRAQLLDAEIARSKAIAEEERKRFTEAKAYASTTGATARAATPGTPVRAAAMKESVYAAAQLADQEKRLAAAERDVTAATRLHSAATLELSQIEKQAALNQAFYEENLSRTRYALFQIGYAYQQVANVAARSLRATASAAIAHEAALAQVARTTNLGQDINAGGDAARSATVQLRAMDEQLVELSRNIPVAFGDLSAITALGAQLGIQKENLIEFTKVVAEFSSTTDVSTEQAAKSFGQLQNILNVPSAQFRNLGSAVSELGTSSVATESDILAVATQIGAIANNAGMSAPYVLGLATALASVRVPPELARGTTTRVFQLMSRAASEGGDKLDAFANVLHRTSAETADLIRNDSQKFFSEFITSLGRSVEAGQDLTPILDDIGIKGARDVPVITRLANAYQLLSEYTSQSASSFAAGTYLEESFQITADTVKASLQEMQNSFQNFLSTVGGPFLRPIYLLAEGLNLLFEGLSKLPAWLTSAVVGFVGAIAVLFAYRAAISIATAAMFAMRVANEGLTNSERVRTPTVRILIQELRSKYAETLRNASADKAATVATQQAAAATTQQATATAGLIAGQRALATTTGATAAGMGTVTATTVAATASTNVLTGALTRVGAALKTIPVIGWVGLIAGLAVGLWDWVSSWGDGVDEVAAKQRELNGQFLAMGTGADGLRKALQEDTRTFNEVGEGAAKASGIYETYSQRIEVAGDGTKNLVGYFKDLNTGIETQAGVAKVGSTTFDEFNSVIEQAGGIQNQAADDLRNTTSELDKQTVAVGRTVDQWRKQNILESLRTAFGPDLQKAINSIGLENLSTLLEGGLKNGGAALDAYIASIRQKLDDIGPEILKTATQYNMEGYAPEFGGKDTQALRDRKKALDDQLTTLLKIQEVLGTSKSTIDQSISEDSAIKQLSVALQTDIDSLQDMDKEADKVKEAIDAALQSFENLMGAATQPVDLQAGLLDSLAKLGDSIGKNGPDFSVYTEAGRRNLSALEDAINSFGEIQQAAIQNQGLSAEQAAANMQAYVADLLNQLSAMGIDTAPLDALEARLAAVTGIPHSVIVNASVSGALTGIAAVHQALNELPLASGMSSGLFSLPVPTAPLPAYQGNVRSISKNLPGSVNPQIAAQTIAASRAKAAAEAAEKANKAAGSAADTASEKIQKQKQYLNDLAGAYKNLGTSIMGMIKAEGDTFEALQQLGTALSENGTQFNTVTERGRKNFDALAGVFDAFGTTLSDSIERGALSASQAQEKYREFASGVYGELVQLGVPTETLTGLFRGLGVSASGWTGNSGDVQQYAGFISAAADAMKKMTDETERAKEWADKLGDALSKAFDRRFGLENAVDSVQGAINGLRDAYQESIDKAEELRIANQKLSDDLSGAQVDKRKAEIEQGISLRYGEVDRAADYESKAGEAQTRIDEAKRQLEANNKERAALEAGRNALDGFSEAAINNRAALQDLQSQMLDQIRAYAASGANTEQVTTLTQQLSDQFLNAARSAGYTEDQVKRYTDTFRLYGDVIRSIPSESNVNVKADTSAATAALNAIPLGRDHITRAVMDKPNYDYVQWQLSLIPKQSDYTVTPKVGGGGVAGINAELASIGAGVTPAANNLFSNIGKSFADALRGALLPVADTMAELFRGLPGFTGHWRGGLIPGYAGGGPVHGPAPRNPFKDNLIARGPDGKVLGIQGGEFVMRRAAVEQYGLDFMASINSGRMGRGLAGGSGFGESTTMMVELSPQDRALLERIPERMPKPELYVDSRRLAEANSRGNVKLAGRGSN